MPFKIYNMKKIPIVQLFIITVVILSSFSCKKDNPQSELVTVNGQTFGCRIDGVPFISDLWDYGNNIPPVRVDFWYSPVLRTREVQIIGKKENQYIEVWLASPVVAGRTLLKATTLPSPTIVHPPSYGLYQKLSPYQTFITNSSIGGYVDILSVDTVTQKIEGRFEFTGTDQTTGKIVTITNGYFKKI